MLIVSNNNSDVLQKCGIPKDSIQAELLQLKDGKTLGFEKLLENEPKFDEECKDLTNLKALTRFFTDSSCYSEITTAEAKGNHHLIKHYMTSMIYNHKRFGK